MSTFNTSGEKTFFATAGVSAGRAVELNSDGHVVHVVTAGTKGIGVAPESIASGEYGNIRLWNAPGTHEIQITGSAVTAGTQYHITTGGQIATTSGTKHVTALESAADGDGTFVEVLVL